MPVRTSSLSIKTGKKGQKMNITKLALELHKYIETLDINEKTKNKIHAKIIKTVTEMFIQEITENNQELFKNDSN